MLQSGGAKGGGGRRRPSPPPVACVFAPRASPPAAWPRVSCSSCLTARCLPACSCSSCLPQAVGEDEHGQRVKRQLGQRGGGGQQGTPRRAPPALHARPHDACWLSHTTTRGALFFLMRAPSSCYFALVAVLGLAALPSFFLCRGSSRGSSCGEQLLCGWAAAPAGTSTGGRSIGCTTGSSDPARGSMPHPHAACGCSPPAGQEADEADPGVGAIGSTHPAPARCHDALRPRRACARKSMDAPPLRPPKHAPS